MIAVCLIFIFIVSSLSVRKGGPWTGPEVDPWDYWLLSRI